MERLLPAQGSKHLRASGGRPSDPVRGRAGGGDAGRWADVPRGADRYPRDVERQRAAQPVWL